MANMIERAKMVKAMEMVARAVSDENPIYDYWFTNGVADGDITDETTPQEIVEMGYCEDKMFRHVMNAFALTMRGATKGNPHGAFYFDGLLSRAENFED